MVALNALQRTPAIIASLVFSGFADGFCPWRCRDRYDATPSDAFEAATMAAFRA
jgi:hypothetical protein